jgi:hypothetical protein
MTRIEKVLRELDDLREFYLRLHKDRPAPAPLPTHSLP